MFLVKSTCYNPCRHFEIGYFLQGFTQCSSSHLIEICDSSYLERILKDK